MTMTCMLTVDGRKMLAKLARGDSDANPVLYVGIGDGTVELDPYDIVLGNEIATRILATVTIPSTNYVKLVVQFTGLTEGDNYSEFGVFDSLVGGIMFSRHSPSILDPGESTVITTRTVPADGVIDVNINYFVIQGSY